MPAFHDDNRTGMHLQRSSLPRTSVEPARAGQSTASGSDLQAQRKRMLIALGILLAALVAVVIKDWDFWFPTRGESPEAVALRKAKAVAEGPAAPAPSPASKEHKAARNETQASAPFIATTERAALPPLQVEVVAGNRSVTVPAKSPAIHVDVASGAGSAVTAPPGAAAFSGGGVRVSRQAAQSVDVSVPPDYPLLARQMKVQGVVSLQALIARDGTIQELQILSGPEILATAAREAVKQWHFKPYLQNGQPVETQARITVNFTISTN
ncbi:MAG TPA: TonB family protein [Terriglobales bacterium]|nr:TonB family protein [Terriglobales bacterium]